MPLKCELEESSRPVDARRPKNRCLRRRRRRARPVSAWAPQQGAARRSTTRNLSGLWRPCSHQQQLRLSWMDSMGVDWHPCASKQAQIVRIALCEQGSGEARRRCEIAAGVRGRGGVRGRFAPERLTIKLRYSPSIWKQAAPQNSISNSILGIFSFSAKAVEACGDHVPSQRVPNSDVPFYAIPLGILLKGTQVMCRVHTGGVGRACAS